jgi:glycosyltransferase involved in cell wall biosynthesis/GT2 family glycosyltransferase
MIAKSIASFTPTVSVVINTDGRAKSLEATIASFAHVDYSTFELCVIHGPTLDGTKELLARLASDLPIKIAACSERNLSQSRNLGIALASGKIVAFIDDDSIPEPEWLTQLVGAFQDSEVAAAGGFVFDPSGYRYQYLYAMCNRLGNARLDLKGPVDEYSLPFSNWFPYVQGTNCAFRRSDLVRIGGFDEEYEFYLDETDVCCRLVDEGRKIRQLAHAAVHHKYLPSHLRNEHRVTTVKYPVIKNKIYFSFVNNHGHFSAGEVVVDAVRFVDQQRADLEYHVRGGRLDPARLAEFERDAEKAWETGLSRGLSRTRRTRPRDFFDARHDFLRFSASRSRGRRRTFIFLSQSYPPGHAGGNGRHTHDIARAIADLGHTVHVLTKGSDFSRVDFEDGVWVHRLVSKQQIARRLPSGQTIPEEIWNHSATLLEELYRISKFRRIDVVEGVSWDCECIATVLDGRFPSATNVVTALSHWLDTHAALRNDRRWMESFGTPLLAVEKYLFARSPGIVAASRAIASSIEERYGVTFESGRIGYSQHGLVDMTPLPRRRPRGLTDDRPGRLAMLFVGRLELRKGIDVLLAATPALLDKHPKMELWIAGDDSFEVEPGLTAKQKYLNYTEQPADDRIRFLGRVSDDELRWLYRHCDIFVAPSRFESFGLIFLEAMMFGKPSVGCRAGGIAEVLEDGVSALLAEPGDPYSLAEAIETLLADTALRRRMGAAARRRYEMRFEASLVARHRVEFLSTLMRRSVPEERLIEHGENRSVEVGYGEQARRLGPGGSIGFATEAPTVYLTFWKHDWSGYVEIWVDDNLVDEVDLFSSVGIFETLAVPIGARHQPVHLSIRRGDRKTAPAHDSEVIVHAIEEADNPSSLRAEPAARDLLAGRA